MGRCVDAVDFPHYCEHGIFLYLTEVWALNPEHLFYLILLQTFQDLLHRGSQNMMLLPVNVLAGSLKLHLGFIKEHISSWPQSSISPNENCSTRSFSLWIRFGWWHTDESCLLLRSVRIWHLYRSHGCSVVSICLRQIYTCATFTS